MLLIEFIWLMRRRGWPVRDALFRLLPGGLMMVALHLALIGAAWWWIALALAASFPAHLLDLRKR